MNLNSDTLIKQEFLTAEEQLISSLDSSHLSTSVKNEPIYDEPISSVTIKNETLNEATCLMENVIVKTENFQELTTTSGSLDNFAVYELKTEPESSGQSQKKNGVEISKSISHSTSQNLIRNVPQAAMNANSKTSLISNVGQCSLSNSHLNNEIQMKVVSSPPVLLNDKLRKRHKVILPTKPLEKRKRYNIEGTKPALEERKNATVSLKASSQCRSLNSGREKIINYTIKSKQKERESEENCGLKTPFIGSICTEKHTAETIITEQDFNVKPSHRIEQKVTTTVQTLPEILAPTSPNTLTSTNDILNISNQSADSPNIPELRVKCLCSLTDEDSSDNSELKTFFQKMFEETRRLNKTQQRKVRISLLKAICDAEDLVEQGKCCSF